MPFIRASVFSLGLLLVSGDVLAIPDFAKLRRQAGITAVAWALVEGQQEIDVGGDGFYSLRAERRVDKNSLLRIGSITKTFTALSALRLAQDGKLDLNEPIRNLLSAKYFTNPWSDYPVTVAQLLEHSAGLQDLSRHEFHYLKPLGLTEALSLFPERRQVLWPPGWHTSYSNASAGLVSAAIEQVTGRDYDTWFSTEVLQWLGMKHSTLVWTRELETQLVTGYDSDLKSPIPYWHTYFRAFGGLNTTAYDMRRLLLFLVNQGQLETRQLLPRAALHRMQTPTVSLAALAGSHFGYGLGIKRTEFRGHSLFSHNGDADGYLARIAYSLESGRAYFVVINAFRHDLLKTFVTPLDNWLIEPLSAPPVPPLHVLSAAVQAKLLGEYREVTRRFSAQFESAESSASRRLMIEDDNGILVRRYADSQRRIHLIPVAPGLFRHRDEVRPSVAWMHGPDGNVYLQGAFGSYQKTE